MKSSNLDSARLFKMCIMIFVGSDYVLPIVEPDIDTPAFAAVSLSAEMMAVVGHFTKRNVVQVNVGGCGCGFAYYDYSLDLLNRDDVPSEIQQSVKEDYNFSRVAVSHLREYIDAVCKYTTCEVYCCWWGDWSGRPESQISVGIDHFGGSCFNFVEKEMLTVIPGASD